MDDQPDQTTPNNPGDQPNRYHKTLERQVGKYLGEQYTISPELATLLSAISDTYAHADEDRRLIERSLEISSRELTENYQRVKEQVDAKTQELQQRTQEAEDSRRTLEATLDNLPVGVMVVKAPGGEALMINRAGAEIIGRNLEPSIDADNYSAIFQLYKEDGSLYPNDQLPLTRTLHTGKAHMADDIWMHRPDGTVVALRAFTAPITHTDGSFSSAVVAFEDISAERNLEHTRDEFFAIASHELRTPLTAIRGNTTMIMDYYPEAVKDPGLAEMVRDIHESSIRLITIVNDFLDMSSLEQQRMKFEFSSFNVIELIREVTKEYESTSKAQGVALVIEDPGTELRPVYADKNRLKQVLINLIGNALKFTNQGHVKISLANEDEHVRIYVSDTGSGISEDAQKMLFHKFEQTGVNPLTRDSVRGTGLGLYISKLLMERMNGDVRLESSVIGKGTTFCLTIPYAQDSTIAS